MQIKALIFVTILMLLMLTHMIFRSYYLNNSINKLKHVYKTPNLNYAHFSEIPTYNPIIFPELLFTDEKKFLLKTGDALFIPKGWWHWVETSEPTIAVNFWMKDDVGIKPHYIKDYIAKNKWKRSVDNLLEKMKNLELMFWSDKHKKCIYSNLDGIKEIEGKTYLITLDSYQLGRYNKDKLNNMINEHVKKPFKSAMEPNLWVSIGYYDTGLHYDDNDGLLVVLKGKKKVRLYSPSDSVFLKPFPKVPKWANYFTSNTSFPNENRLVNSHSNHKCQAYELYLCLYERCNEKSVFTIADTLYEYFGKEKVVWGIKKNRKSGDIRLEFYIYNILDGNKSHDRLISKDKIKSRLQKIDEIKRFEMKGDIEQPKVNDIPLDSLIIFSFNVYLDYPCCDNEIHLYYKTNSFDNKSSNFKCDGKYVNEKNIHWEGYMYGSHYSHFELEECFRSIGYEDYEIGRKVLGLISKNPCRMIFIWNKDNYILFQLCGITTNSYLKFLKKYDYPQSIIRFIKENLTTYNEKNISHDIGFSIDKKDKKVDRTAIYGIL